MAEQDVTELVKRLEEASHLKKHGKATKITCSVFDRPDVKLDSWKFNEWDYGKPKIVLPCNARGLFIQNADAEPRIVTRGYDKFFNIDEVQRTSWRSIQDNTEGPYEITVKENGCIILIGGLEDGTVVVCSKHSTGPRDDINRNHSQAGQQFLEQQLKEKNLGLKDLGRYLYEANCTAIAEYCDDTFEEHILEYNRDDAGLYLHGLNYNTVEFSTFPMAKVAEFANEWGFKHIDYFTTEDSSSLKTFLTECEKAGHYNNQEIEGFVIRCKDKSTGGTFFFKYKFKEPYLMYRQWREVTREYISTRQRVFRYRSHNYITNKYMDFVIPLLDRDPKLANDFMNGKGIIKLRKLFLEDYGMSGLEILNLDKIKELEEAENHVDNVIDENTKFLLVTIATIGCGKSTVSLTLNELFPESWGLVVNDNITSNKTDYIKSALQLFKDGKQFVVADKNNHQFRERAAVFEWINQFRDSYIPYNCNLQVIALCFVDEVSPEMRALTIDRVMKRGDNHQSIKSESDDQQKVLKIMQGFMNRFQPFLPSKDPDNKFDFHIQLEVGKNSSLKNTITVLKELQRNYGDVIPPIPDDSIVHQAFERALNYKPTITKIIKGGNKIDKKQHKPVYFSANVIESDLLLQHVRKTIEAHATEYPSLLKSLDSTPFKDALHITLCHKSQIRSVGIKAKQMWAKYLDRYKEYLSKEHNSEPTKNIIATEDSVSFKLIDLIWDKHVILATVALLDDTHPIVMPDGTHADHLTCLNKVPHITLALFSNEKTAKYSGELAKEVYEFGIQESDTDTGMISLGTTDNLQFSGKVCINL
ncbi:Trl1 [Kluyveromyces lactis]|nr:Trl1 [Kluyveromyces lactis]